MSDMKIIMENWRLFTEDALEFYDSRPGTDFRKMIDDMKAKPENFSLPLHVRGFKDFLLGRTEKWTEQNLNSKEIDALRVAAKAVGAHRSRRKKVINYRHWRGLSKGVMGKDYKAFTASQQKKRRQQGQTFVALKQDTGLFETEYFNSLSRFLGTVTVQRRGKNLVFKDHYDFNDAHKKNSFGELWKDLKGIFSDDSYSIVRRMAPWRQSTGYKGFPVEITIPIKA